MVERVALNRGILTGPSDTFRIAFLNHTIIYLPFWDSFLEHLSGSSVTQNTNAFNLINILTKPGIFNTWIRGFVYILFNIVSLCMMTKSSDVWKRALMLLVSHSIQQFQLNDEHKLNLGHVSLKNAWRNMCK